MGEIDLGCLAMAEMGSRSERVGGARGGKMDLTGMSFNYWMGGPFYLSLSLTS
jgi:hypothetical protein